MAVIATRRAGFTGTWVQPRDVLDAAYRRPDIITHIEVGRTGRLTPRTIAWGDYWRPVFLLDDRSVGEAIARFGTAWQSYIGSDFDDRLARNYCYQYPGVLDAVARADSNEAAPAVLRDAIRTTVAFECAGIVDRAYLADPVAAVTTTARNPVYLLTRLKWPTIPHSTRFLPLVASNQSGPDTFGHYRRYPLSEDGTQSLLVYPRNTLGNDARSLQAIATVASALGAESDPFVADRARRLWEFIVRPLLEQENFGRGQAWFDLVDLGGGTGALAGSLCASIADWSGQAGSDPRFRLALVDLCRTTTSPILSEPELARRIDAITHIVLDYRAWLAGSSRQSVFPSRRGLSFGLACKVFDMASQFVVQSFRRGDLPEPPAAAEWFRPEDRSPLACLAPRGRGPEQLMVSPLRFQVEDGHVFAQPALSDYFAALASISAGQVPGLAGSVSLPVRVFDPATLVTTRGTSVLGEMLHRVNHLVIEDADLRPSELLAHLRRFDVSDIVVFDMTSTMRLTGNYAYVLLRRPDPLPLPRLEGDRLA